MSLFSRVSMLSGVVVVAATLTPVTASSGVEPAPLNGEVWASDLPFVSEVNGWGPAQRDRSNGEQGATDGRTIWVDGKSHTKGIGVHADSAIRFDVGGDCEFFQAEVGIDDEVGTRGSVVFAVVADGLQVAQTATLTGASDAKTIYASIDGAQHVDLLVSQAEGSSTYDHADWASAKFRCSGDGVAAPVAVPAPPTTAVYASDWPFLGVPSNGWGPVELDRANGGTAAGDGPALKMQGVTYAKGLGAHAASFISYNLGGQCSAFTAKVGVDDSMGSYGTVRFRVFADGVEIADTGKMYNSTATKALSLTTTGAERLDILVDNSGDNSDRDHADLADARLVCGDGAAGAAFYTPPATLPAGLGKLVRTEPSQFWVTPLKVVPVDAAVTRMMYTSSDRNDTQIPVTGQLVVPNKAWTGTGPRPLVAYAVGTQGLADNCAPSRLSDGGGLEYENIFIAGLLSRGYAIVVTDYQGLGTPGVHTYMSREVQGRAVLDSVRAALAVPNTGLTTSTPIAITGYSQGGGAAASAAEIASSYAPELTIAGVATGGVPGDLLATADKLDGTLTVGFLGYAVAGVGEGSYGIDINSFLNAKGRALIAELKEECVIETVLTHGFIQSSTLTLDGRSVPTMLRDPEWNQMISDQLIGNGRKPSVPTLVFHSGTDDVVPYGAGLGTAQRWCAQGANVTFRTGFLLGHIGGAFEYYPNALKFLEDRLAGVPVTSNCSTI